MATTKTHDNLNRLTAIGSAPSASATVSYGYTYNDANQRIEVAQADNSKWVYQYDALGQVISGKRYWSDTTPVAGQQFEYGFDDIGNRETSKAGGDASGANLRTASYTANTLNQYTSRTFQAGFDVMGTDSASATVTVNNQSTYRKGTYFRREVAVNNSAAPVWQGVTNVGVLNQSGGNPDIVTSKAGRRFVPKATEAYTHDADGNLLSDGRWSYTWDAENRLVKQETLPLAYLVGVPQQKLEYAYDDQSRRVSKKVYNWVSGAWALAESRQFVWDGWNLKVELLAGALDQALTWGSDLSGTMQGAGGVGGLLWASDGTTRHARAYDGNGNVTLMVNLADGTESGRYEYAPFGELLRTTGEAAEANRFLFSTKYEDKETGFLYYGYRYFDTSTGRWANRDPLNELGFMLMTMEQQPTHNHDSEEDDEPPVLLTFAVEQHNCPCLYIRPEPKPLFSQLELSLLTRSISPIGHHQAAQSGP